MVNWQSPDEILKDGAAFDRFMHVLLGLYIWEFVTSLDFDWAYISGKRSYRWPLFFYFANRYVLIFALIGIAIALNVTSEVNCQALYTFNQIFGNAAVGLASINLSLRTIAIWSQSRYVVIPLVIVILGHWSVLMQGVLLTAAWVPGTGCVITKTSNTVLAASFIYSMVFDFTVLCLMSWKLVFTTRRAERSRLVSLIFNDGLIFFFIAFLANLLATIFMLLNLNPVMSIIANVPAAIASTIVAGRVVRRLTNFQSQGVEMFASTQNSSLAFNTRTGRSRGPISVVEKKQGSGVHVQMETFATVGEALPSDQTLSHFDSAGEVMKSNSFDAEAQEIVNDFKRHDSEY